MKYTWKPPIQSLGALLEALYTGNRASKKIDADIVLDGDEIFVREHYSKNDIVCSPLSRHLFDEAKLWRYVEKKNLENLHQPTSNIFRLTRNTKTLEEVHVMRLKWNDANKSV